MTVQQVEAVWIRILIHTAFLQSQNLNYAGEHLSDIPMRCHKQVCEILSFDPTVCVSFMTSESLPNYPGVHCFYVYSGYLIARLLKS